MKSAAKLARKHRCSWHAEVTDDKKAAVSSSFGRTKFTTHQTSRPLPPPPPASSTAEHDNVTRPGQQRRAYNATACRRVPTKRNRKRRRTRPETLRLPRWTWTLSWSSTSVDATATWPSRWRWWACTAPFFWRASPATCARASSSWETSECTPPPTTTSSRSPSPIYWLSYSVSCRRCQLCSYFSSHHLTFRRLFAPNNLEQTIPPKHFTRRQRIRLQIALKDVSF